MVFSEILNFSIIYKEKVTLTYYVALIQVAGHAVGQHASGYFIVLFLF